MVKSSNQRIISYWALLILIMIGCGSCLFERDKGMNDWKIENLGNLTDLKFLDESQLIYTFSNNGVLTLFDTNAKKIVWKKELP